MSTQNKYKRITESGIVKNMHGHLVGLIVNSHTSGTVKITDGPEGGNAASTVLTSAGACVPANYAVTELTSTGAMVAGSHAVTVFTMTGAVVAGQTITIGTTVYTARATVDQTSAAYDVYMGASTAEFLDNLKLAINLTSYATNVGVKYGPGTAAHPSVVATTNTDTAQTVRGRVPGTSLNTVATTETFTNGSWADTTLGGGTGASDPGVTTAAATVTIGDITYTCVVELSETLGASAVAYQFLYGGSEAVMLDNLKLAVNATGTAGTQYSTGTLVHPTVIATTNTDTVQTFRSRSIGTAAETTAINAIVTTETMANTAFADTTLGGGTGNSNPAVTTDAAQFTLDTVTYTAVIVLAETLGLSAVANQILWVTSEAVFLDNIKLAVNASGIAGTDYSTGTVEHPTVYATTNTNTEQTFVAKRVGTGGNSIATTETLGNYSFTSTVMASGTGANGRIMHNTITLGAAERFIPFYDEAFDTGLYITVGGTLDATLVYD